MRYREALSNATCPNCGGPTAIGEMSFDEHHLRLENARLREEVLNSILGFSSYLILSLYFYHFFFYYFLKFASQIDRISAIAAKYVGKPVSNYPLLSTPIPSRPLELGMGGYGGHDSGGDMYGAADLLRP